MRYGTAGASGGAGGKISCTIRSALRIIEKFSTSTLDLISLFFNLGFSYDRVFITKGVPLYSWSAASAASHLLNVLILLLVYNQK